MRTFALIDERALDLPYVTDLGWVTVADRPVRLGTVEVPQPDFDSSAPENADSVQVRIDALSCNYRDKSLVMFHAEQLDRKQNLPFAFIGSEFSGTVMAVGQQVSQFSVGDTVIPDASYPESPAPGVQPGIVTNHAGAGWLTLHERKLAHSPDEMSSEIGAAFSLGAQTSTSMVRRAAIEESDRVLVTSARSNTSGFILQALVGRGAHTWASSSSPWDPDAEHLLRGASLVHAFPDGSSAFLDEKTSREVSENGGFTVVLDPFFDLHLEHVVDLMAPGGRYVTCGLMNQHPSFPGTPASYEAEETSMRSLDRVMLTVMMKNLNLIGNCIGTSGDLYSALQKFRTEDFHIPVDAGYSPEGAAEFLRRTFEDRGRHGKTVMTYQQG